MKHMFRHGIMTKADFGLIAAVLVLACVIPAGRLFGRTQGGWVVVSRSGVEEERLPLEEDTRLLLRDEKGQENLLVVENKSVWMEDAGCPDGLCIRQGHISRSGESIICLPHKLVVTIEARGSAEKEKKDSAPDAVVN